MQPTCTTAMKITVNDRLYLSEIRPSDKAAFIKHLNDKNIYDNTLPTTGKMIRVAAMFSQKPSESVPPK